MTTATFNANVIADPARAIGRSAAALRSLMNAWEQEVPGDDDESEAELMVLLSGMVSPDVTTLGDA